MAQTGVLDTWQDSPLAAFGHVLEHEKLVTGRINDLVDLSLEVKDHATESLLHWFVDERVEEETSPDKVIQGQSSKKTILADCFS